LSACGLQQRNIQRKRARKTLAFPHHSAFIQTPHHESAWKYGEPCWLKNKEFE